ncbi:SMP-30/gluconolactonase/LRE family protein [Alcaligenaceae bacterium]|nr:SMP-30/gluconolactonase/LRE family protein [Alcaligenaceae bacterium]
MYAAPPRKKMELFASVPAQFHRKGINSTWVNVQLHGASTPAFLEGPAFDAAGNLWVVDIPWGRLFMVKPDGNMDCKLEYDGEPNGLTFHPDGRIFIADNKNGIMVFDPRKETIEPYLDRALVQRFKGPNDLTFASNGDLYFTDQGQTGLHDPTGRVYRLTQDGRLDTLLSHVPSPNGLTLNLNEDILYVAVTRSNAIWRVPLVSKLGLVTKVGKYIQMSGGGGPDGVALDSHGGLAVCHVGLGAVWIFNEDGEPSLRLDSPSVKATTNCAYGGPQNRHLFVTAGTDILFAEVDIPGHPTASQRVSVESSAPGV